MNLLENLSDIYLSTEILKELIESKEEDEPIMKEDRPGSPEVNGETETDTDRRRQRQDGPYCFYF